MLSSTPASAGRSGSTGGTFVRRKWSGQLVPSSAGAERAPQHWTLCATPRRKTPGVAPISRCCSVRGAVLRRFIRPVSPRIVDGGGSGMRGCVPVRHVGTALGRAQRCARGTRVLTPHAGRRPAADSEAPLRPDRPSCRARQAPQLARRAARSPKVRPTGRSHATAGRRGTPCAARRRRLRARRRPSREPIRRGSDR